MSLNLPPIFKGGPGLPRTVLVLMRTCTKYTVSWLPPMGPSWAVSAMHRYIYHAPDTPKVLTKIRDILESPGSGARLPPSSPISKMSKGSWGTFVRFQKPSGCKGSQEPLGHAKVLETMTQGFQEPWALAGARLSPTNPMPKGSNLFYVQSKCVNLFSSSPAYQSRLTGLLLSPTTTSSFIFPQATSIGSSTPI